MNRPAGESDPTARDPGTEPGPLSPPGKSQAFFCDHPLGAAIVEVVATEGYREAGVGGIIARAGVTRQEFDRLFSGKADAVQQVLESMIEDFRRRVGGAYAGVPGWPGSLRAAAYEVVAWIEDHPHAYEFGMLGVLEAGEMPRLRREELFTWCAALIDAGRAVAPDPAAVPAAAALIAVGAVVDGLARHASGEPDAGLVETVPKLMYGAVLPYLGGEAARRELSARAPRGGR
ncbi:MAG TPA: TetR/AcrR family transcriptional regulator [Solirubrobacterales bacterium]|jgi:AcrR family transcriptional regulator|nr:TetR/AcrR family transcriptional regulator [Solirubrobacterales bacterium]